MNGKTATTVNGTPEELYAGAAEASETERAAEAAQARRLAERYRLEYVDISRQSIDHDLFRAIPADLMLRYGFVP
jgi:hypothetical protein